jgi:hypothetical protein
MQVAVSADPDGASAAGQPRLSPDSGAASEHGRANSASAIRRRVCDDPDMRIPRHAAVISAAAAAVLCIAELAAAASAAAAPASHWRAVEVPTAAHGIDGALTGIGCPGTSCVAGGGYYDSATRNAVPMITAESSGKWSSERALQLPGNVVATGDNATVSAMACPSSKVCLAVGYYTTTAAPLQGFIATGHGTSWQRAVAASLPANAASPPAGYLTGISCTSPGECLAVGGYTDSAGDGEAMVQAQSHGKWLRATAVKSPANAAANPSAHLVGVSCPKAGDCVAVGAYTTKSFDEEVMAAVQTKGRWAQATQIQLPAGASPEPQAALNAVACASPQYCVAVGNYVDTDQHQQALAVTRAHGGWQRAADVHKLLPSNANAGDSYGDLNGVTCPAAGSCLAVGSYENKQAATVPLAITQAKGVWGRAAEVGLPPRALAGSAQVAFLYAVSCGSRLCTAVGGYTASTRTTQGLAAIRSSTGN